MLVGMVRLQAGKLRVSEFVEDRSKMLSDIADQAKEEYDKIAEDAMRTMDEASSKVPIFILHLWFSSVFSVHCRRAETLVSAACQSSSQGPLNWGWYYGTLVCAKYRMNLKSRYRKNEKNEHQTHLSSKIVPRLNPQWD